VVGFEPTTFRTTI